MNPEIKNGLDYQPELAALFKAYTDELMELCPAFAAYLELQHYDKELEDLSLKYGTPGSLVDIVFVDEKPAGCAGLIGIDQKRAELKRFYIDPSFRRMGLAQRLLDQILMQAGRLGYSLILLDTLPELDAALKLYEKNGFTHCERYNDSPLDFSIYLKKCL